MLFSMILSSWRQPLLRGYRLLTVGAYKFHLRWLQKQLPRMYQALRPKRIVELQMETFSLVVDPADLGVVPSLLTMGEYSAVETTFMRRMARQSGTVLDIGANIGFMTLIASEVMPNDRVRVYGFEPVPYNAALFTLNMQRNRRKNVQLCQFALSDTQGAGQIFLDAANFGNPSMSARNIGSGTDSIAISTRTLMDVAEEENISTVDFIKIDTQGAEQKVLRGGEALIERDHPVLLMELWPYGLTSLGGDAKTLLEWMKNKGYRLFKFHGDELVSAEGEVLIAECLRVKQGKGFENVVLVHPRSNVLHTDKTLHALMN